jgi:archaeal type IV pilus assembly protein PilA
MSGIKTVNKKSRKGISPVIATVILVAVAVVIAAALAGFSSSLFGTYSSQGAAVNVKSLEVNSNGDFTLDMVNNGNTRDTIVSISVPPNAATPVDAIEGELAPHMSLAVPITGIVDLDASVVAGSTITVKINMASGVQLTQSVIVAPAA